MKLRNKILIVFFILALALCLTFASSASEYDFIASGEFSSLIDIQTGYINSYTLSYPVNDETARLTMLYIDAAGAATQGKSIFFIQPNGFKQFVDLCTNSNGDCSYNDFILFCGDYTSTSNSVSSFFFHSWYNSESTLTEAYYNKLYHYNDELTYSDGFVDGTTEGIKQAQDFASDYLEENGLLSEPFEATGTFETFENFLADNVIANIQKAKTDTVDAALNKLEAWLRSKNLTVKDYNRDNTVDAIDRLISANFDSAYTDWVKVGRSDAVLRLKTWLNDNNISYTYFENNGLLSDIDNGLNLNVLPALDARQAEGYELGKTDGQALGKTAMFNELVTYFNDTYDTEYPTAVGSSYDFGVLQDAYTSAYQAGELYQINKFTDDGGISDFLADISGTVLSTFFYLGTNISFMGTTALSLISLFVIAAIVIFILKFFNKG